VELTAAVDELAIGANAGNGPEGRRKLAGGQAQRGPRSGSNVEVAPRRGAGMGADSNPEHSGAPPGRMRIDGRFPGAAATPCPRLISHNPPGWFWGFRPQRNQPPGNLPATAMIMAETNHQPIINVEEHPQPPKNLDTRHLQPQNHPNLRQRQAADVQPG